MLSSILFPIGLELGIVYYLDNGDVCNFPLEGVLGSDNAPVNTIQAIPTQLSTLTISVP